jgi:hypothetical protein
VTNIVICCDGTWNTADRRDGGIPVPTNVVRLYNAIPEEVGAGTKQHRYYHPGVGTNGSLWDKAIGGGTGRGLDRNIMSAYRELCDYYQAGDDIFLFGFSRGAYTVRSLAGLVSSSGLLKTAGLTDSEIWERIERVFQQGYRRKSEKRELWETLEWGFHNEPGEAIPIRFLGVWDTVGALGIPDDLALLNLIDNLHDYTFHNTNLSPSIQTARHAVALDEMRASFQPTLWIAAADQDAKQVWFTGVHSDVGGGYRETGLSDVALKWMLQEAENCGLVFNQSMVKQIKSDPLAVLHNSCSGAFALLPTQPRSAPLMSEGTDIHSSALQRQLNPPINQCPYRPDRAFTPSLPVSLDIFALHPWNETGVWLEADTSYTFTATGEWMDSSITCGPGGTSDGNFQVAELAQLAGSVLGQVEELFKKLTGNKSADFRFTKRHEAMPWFCLVGAIANGGGVDAKGYLEPHESFKIGSGCTYTPRKSGYFFAYANDAWNCYGNNRGRLQLAIR